MCPAPVAGFRLTCALLALTLCVSGCGLTEVSPRPPSPESYSSDATTPSVPASALTKEAFLAAGLVGKTREAVVIALGLPEVASDGVMLYPLKEPAGAYGAVTLVGGTVSEVGVW